MRQLGTIELEILHLAINEKGTFNETNLENSPLKRLGVGKILDTLASLKDKKMLTLNNDGSFSITSMAREILWSVEIPIWAKILRLLQIKSCSVSEISDILKIPDEKIFDNLETLRKSQFVLMSPQRQNDKLIKIYEILPEGTEKIDKTESEGFEDESFAAIKPEIEILGLIDEVVKEIQGLAVESDKKEAIVEKLSKVKEKLEI